MDSKASSTVPEAKKESKRAQDSSELDPTQQSLHGKYFSSQEMCYLAHHVNEAHDFRSLCRMFNTQFGPDRALQSVEKFLERCDEALFIALTEKAQDYKWCKPHPISSILPPTIVLGTADWRTELRAFLVFQTSKDVSLAELDESLSATFPEESRTSMQIKTQLGQINKKPGLFLYLEWFAARYPWHSDYVAGASTSKPPTMKFKTDTRAAARARLSQGKEKPTNYKDKEAALDDQLELTHQRTDMEEESLVAQWKLVVKHTNMCGIPRIPSSALAGSTHASLFDHLPAALPEPATVDPGPSAVSEPHGADATAAAGLSLTPTTEEERVLEEAGGMDPELYMELFHDAKNRSAHR